MSIAEVWSAGACSRLVGDGAGAGARPYKSGGKPPHSKKGQRTRDKGQLLTLCLCLLVLSGCRQDMADQPRYDALAASSFFPDGRSARPLVPGTVARGHLRTDEHFYTGKAKGVEVTTFPFPITREVLERGRERFNIYCTPCHDRLGSGEGMVVQRGFRHPPSYHTDKLRDAPVGHFYDVITNGFGAMADYADRISPRDRWAIVAYIRALQFSQRATLADVPPDERQKLAEAPKAGSK